jgi:hypothetical protein
LKDIYPINQPLTASAWSQIEALPYRYLHILRANGEIYFLPKSSGMVIGPFTQGQTVDVAEVSPTGVLLAVSSETETVTLISSFSRRIFGTSKANGTSPIIDLVKGQYAVGTVPNPITKVFPFIGGAMGPGAINGGTQAVYPLQMRDGAGLAIGEQRQEMASNATIAPNASAAYALVYSEEMVTLKVVLGGGDVLDVQGIINGSPAFSPIVYDLTTGLATAALGRIAASGTYFFLSEGFSGFNLLAPVTNGADATGIYVSASRACRPAQLPVQIYLGPDGFPISDSHALAVRAHMCDASGNYYDSTVPFPVSPQSEKATYRTYFAATATAAGALAKLVGSASKTIKLTRAVITGLEATAAAFVDIQLTKHSANPGGGTSAATTLTPLDSDFAAASATAFQYSVAGATSAPLGAIGEVRAFANATGTPIATMYPVEFIFGDAGQSPIVLRGTGQAILFEAVTAGIGAGASLKGFFEWTEE